MDGDGMGISAGRLAKVNGSGSDVGVAGMRESGGGA